jgi:ribonuclease HI
MKTVSVYTDGAAKGNPGAGGYGVILEFGTVTKEYSGGFDVTTNNRMELYAAITGLESLNEPCRVTLYSDSRYLVDAMNKGWLEKWKSLGWRRNKKDLLKNADLWQRLDAIVSRHNVEWNWVKGHAGHEQNERCDSLAENAAYTDNRPEDEGFLNPWHPDQDEALLF